MGEFLDLLEKHRFWIKYKSRSLEDMSREEVEELEKLYGKRVTTNLREMLEKRWKENEK